MGQGILGPELNELGSSHPEGHVALKSNGKEHVEAHSVKWGNKLYGSSKVATY